MTVLLILKFADKNLHHLNAVGHLESLILLQTLDFWLMLMQRNCLCTWTFLHHDRFAEVGFGTGRDFFAALLEFRGISLWLGR